MLPTIDNWLGQLSDPDHIAGTISSLANFEIALSVTDDPDTIAGFARQIERTRAERKNAELRLRRLTTGKGLSEDEIRQVVQSLADAVKLLAGASPQDRRRVYEAARLEVLYDHENRRPSSR